MKKLIEKLKINETILTALTKKFKNKLVKELVEYFNQANGKKIKEKFVSATY